MESEETEAPVEAAPEAAAAPVQGSASESEVREDPKVHQDLCRWLELGER